MTDTPAPRPRPASEMRAGHADREEVVERLRVAAGDGRIDLDELEERLELAFAAKTYGELDALVADLPDQGGPGPGTGTGTGTGIETGIGTGTDPQEPLVLRTVAGEIRQTGHWVVPQRIVARNTLGETTIDFTRAECRHREVRLEIDTGMGEVRIIVPRGWSVRTEGLSSKLGSVRNRATEPHVPGMPVLRISGGSKVGTIVVRHPFRLPGRRSRD